MKNIFFIKFSLIILLFLSSTSYSSERIVYIDFEFIVNNSDRGKSIFKDLNNKRNEDIKNLKLDEKKIRDQENDLKSKKDIISKDEFDKKLKILNLSIKKFQDKKKLIENELTKIKNEKMNNFMQQINALLEIYMNDQSLDMILNSKNILIGKKNIDKTEDILKLINENIK